MYVFLAVIYFSANDELYNFIFEKQSSFNLLNL